MNTSQLKTFVVLARTLSYTETAHTLYVSQPAVTQQIARLEAELGATLLDRSTRGVTLTQAGRSFYEDCLDILARLDAAEARARRTDEAYEGRLRIGCPIPACVVRMPPLLAELRRRLPRVDISLVKVPGEEAISQLTHGDLDVVIANRSTRALPAGVTFDLLRDVPFVCVVSADSPLADRSSLTVEDLDGTPLVCLEEGVAPAEMHDVQAAVLLATKRSPVMFCASELIGATMATAGLGAAVMPDDVCPDVAGSVRVPMPDVPTVPFGIYRMKRGASEPVRAFVACARERFGVARASA